MDGCFFQSSTHYSVIYFSYRKETSISVLKGQCAGLSCGVVLPHPTPRGGRGQASGAEVLRNPGDSLGRADVPGRRLFRPPPARAQSSSSGWSPELAVIGEGSELFPGSQRALLSAAGSGHLYLGRQMKPKGFCVRSRKLWGAGTAPSQGLR